MNRALAGLILLSGFAAAQPAHAPIVPARFVRDMAQTVERQWPAGVISTVKNPGVWAYEEGVLLDGMAAAWTLTRDPATLAYIRAAVDRYVSPDGTIRMNAAGKPFDLAAHSLDNIEMGRSLLFLYTETHAPRYLAAATELHRALAMQPRTPSEGFWHKAIYPNQMWLDGAYMAEPFRARYAALTGSPADWQDIALQFELMDSHLQDSRTGLLRHGWDESRAMPWADKTTGQSPEVWARAMGWYLLALADTLEDFPASEPGRKPLERVFARLTARMLQFQAPDGLWWEVMDQGPRQQVPGGEVTTRQPRAGNFPESSASCMFVASTAKGVRLGLLPPADLFAARRGWQGIASHFIQTAPDGGLLLTGTVKGAGLGGNPYRPGTYSYYIGEEVGSQDSKGVGACLMAASELARAK